MMFRLIIFEISAGENTIYYNRRIVGTFERVDQAAAEIRRTAEYQRGAAFDSKFNYTKQYNRSLQGERFRCRFDVPRVGSKRRDYYEAVVIP